MCGWNRSRCLSSQALTLWTSSRSTRSLTPLSSTTSKSWAITCNSSSSSSSKTKRIFVKAICVCEHSLICLVSYMTERQERMQFKKFYKFVVSKPFEIQPRFPFLSPVSDFHHFHFCLECVSSSMHPCIYCLLLAVAKRARQLCARRGPDTEHNEQHSAHGTRRVVADAVNGGSDDDDDNTSSPSYRTHRRGQQAERQQCVRVHAAAARGAPVSLPHRLSAQHWRGAQAALGRPTRHQLAQLVRRTRPLANPSASSQCIFILRHIRTHTHTHSCKLAIFIFFLHTHIDRCLQSEHKPRHSALVRRVLVAADPRRPDRSLHVPHSQQEVSR